MSSTQPSVSSITSRLVVRFTAACVGLVACALGIFYWLVTRHTFEEDNAALADKVSALRQEMKNSGLTKALDAELQGDRAGEHSSYWVRVIDPHGAILAERDGMARRLPPNIFPRASTGYSWNQPVCYRWGRNQFSLGSAAVEGAGGLYLIQVAQDPDC